MSKVVQLNPLDTASFLERVAKELRKRKEPQPTLCIVLGLRRDGECQVVEHWACPSGMDALQFVGLTELGKANYTSHNSED